MKFEIELTRNNTTPARFLADVRRKVDAKGGKDFRSDLNLDYFRAGNDLNFEINHMAKNDDCFQITGCRMEKSISRPYEMQTFVSWSDGQLYNEICEFEFDNEKTGHGYYYLLNIGAE